MKRQLYIYTSARLKEARLVQLGWCPRRQAKSLVGAVGATLRCLVGADSSFVVFPTDVVVPQSSSRRQQINQKLLQT